MNRYQSLRLRILKVLPELRAIAMESDELCLYLLAPSLESSVECFAVAADELLKIIRAKPTATPAPYLDLTAPQGKTGKTTKPV